MSLGVSRIDIPSPKTEDAIIVTSDRLESISRFSVDQAAASYSENTDVMPLLAEKQTDAGRLMLYLQRLSEKPVNLPENNARAVRAVWSKLCLRVGMPLRSPIAGPGGEMGFQLAWNMPEYYLDIDIDSEGKFEWYFINRKTGEEAGSDDNLLDQPTEDLIQKLFIFCRAR